MSSDSQVFSPGPGAGANVREKSASCLTLIGPFREEKHRIAERLASRLQWGWIDTDHLMEAWFGLSLNAIKTKLGFPGFLTAQDQVLPELDVACLIIAAGSGATLSPNVLRFLQHQGIIVFLRPPDRKGEQQIRREFLQGFDPKPEVSGQDLLLGSKRRFPETADLILPAGVSSTESASDFILKGFYGQQETAIEAKQAF